MSTWAVWRAAPPRSACVPFGRLGDFASQIKYVLMRVTCQHPGWAVGMLLLEAQRRPSLAGLVFAQAQRSATAGHNDAPPQHGSGAPPEE